MLQFLENIIYIVCILFSMQIIYSQIFHLNIIPDNKWKSDVALLFWW